MSNSTDPDDLYHRVTADHGPALARLARAFEADPDKRRDLLQEIHLAIWQSLQSFQDRCSVRTWVLRVAHHTAISHIRRQSRWRARMLVGIEALEIAADPVDFQDAMQRSDDVQQLLALIHRLKPLERQLVLLYLEDADTALMAEVTGLSPSYVRVMIHRIKSVLAKRFKEAGL